MPRKMDPNAPYWRQLQEFERRMIQGALDATGTIRKAAIVLGVSSSFLVERTNELGCVRPPDPDGPVRRPRTKKTNGKKPQRRKKPAVEQAAAAPAPASTPSAPEAATVIPFPAPDPEGGAA